MEPGSVKGLHLVVDDIATARQGLIGRGVSVGEIMDRGAFSSHIFAIPTVIAGCCRKFLLASGNNDMPEKPTAGHFIQELEQRRSPEELKKYQRFFKFSENRPLEMMNSPPSVTAPAG